MSIGERGRVDESVHVLPLPSTATAASTARRFLQEQLAGMPDDLLGSAELVLSELVTNAVLHGAPPIEVRLRQHGEGLRVEVSDGNHRPPVRIIDPGEGMTGRGLALISALSSSWGAEQSPSGKTVWAEVGHESVPGVAPPSDVDALLAAWHDGEDDADLRSVELGDVPTDLLLAAKAHVDNLAREFALAASGPGAAPSWMHDLVQSVVKEFASARTQIKEQAISAASRGDVVTHLVLRLPASAAEAGQRYLSALDAADRFAREARLLTVEAPAVHKLFRRWYIESLTDQLRTAPGRTSRVPTFAERLAQEVTELSPLRETASRLAMVQQVTADVAAAATVDEVAWTVVKNAREILRASLAVVYLLGDDEMLRAVSVAGRGDEKLAAAYGTFPLAADLPGGLALRTGRPLVYRSASELAKRFPALTGSYPEETRFLIAPLMSGHAQYGVLALEFLGTDVVDEQTQLAMLGTLSGVTGQALERAAATSRAAGAAQKLALLAEASVVLASSLDHRAVLQGLAQLLVPRLADWCAIHLVTDGGGLSTVALAHGDPEVTRWARAQPDRYPASIDLPTGAPVVVRTGRSEVYPEITDELLVDSAVDDEHLESLRSLGLRCAMVVPLSGRTGVIGAISLVHASSGRQFRPEDVRLAEDLARRAAIAVETAHAFREQSTRLADVIRVAEAAQHAILAQPPAQVGRVALAARYLSAAAEALVGGDLYETIERPGAVRLLIGDVRGKGLEAVRIATIVLGEFRAAAADLDDLTEVARQMDRRVRSYLGDEDFVTALIADINDDGSYTLVDLGHPPPLLASGGTVTEVPCPPSLPLGLGVDPKPVEGRLGAGDRLLLYTDGIMEARDPSGAFVDLHAMTASLGTEPLEDVLDEVLREVQLATGGPLNDDLALLVAEYRGPA